MKKTILVFIGMAFMFLYCNKDKKQPETETKQPKFNFVAKAVPKFNSERAWAFLVNQVKFGPRSPNTRAHDECLEYLKTRLQETTPNVVLQNFAHKGYKNETLKMTNIIASYEVQIGTRILLCAHWDSRPRADKETDPKKKTQAIPGANDGASGVAVLLELAKIMKDNPPSIGIDILLVDGEDYGEEGDLESYFLGARHFIKTKSGNYMPIYGILLDLVGDKNLSIPKETNSISYMPQLVNHIWNIAGELNISAFKQTTGGGVSDDHVILSQGGIPCIDIIDQDLVSNSSDNPDRNYWHTLRDTPERCSKESLKSVGDVLLTFIYSKPLL
jgi:glutaminyl-peptide cyclotransferase